MADVIIKGMDMPENCYYCPACAGEYGICQADKEHRYVPDAGIRPDWCPLRPAPEWISVETPPEEEGEYDVYTERQEVLTTVGLYDIYGNIAFMETGVTHWRPRPEPPAGGDGDD